MYLQSKIVLQLDKKLEKISEKTRMDEKYISTMLRDLLFHGYVIIDEENRFHNPLNKILNSILIYFLIMV